MFLRAVALSASLVVASIANAATFNGPWWNPAESGWGVNFDQQSNAMHITLSVYGSDGKPKWYSASAAPGTVLPSGHPRWDGDLYETTTPPSFGAPFNPADVKYRKVGSIAFLPATDYSGTLIYDVDANGVTKPIQRHTFGPIPFEGQYYGKYSTCDCDGRCKVYALDVFMGIMSITPDADGVTGRISTVMTFGNTAYLRCDWSGKYQQFGSVFAFSDMAACASPVGELTLQSLSASADGSVIHGRMPIAGKSCPTFVFSAIQTRKLFP